MIDFRSDTQTRPTKEMLAVMFDAPVGDDVFREDPSVNSLEQKTAALFGMEAALFCPSGTMTNQIAIKCHTVPGDEVVCDQTAHIYQYEGGGIAFNSSASVSLIPGDRGRITAGQVAARINPDDVHKPPTTLVCLENTSNRGGGSCYDLQEIQRIRNLCDERGLILHLDGARLFNALVARGESPADHGRLFHSISICLSKSLGCPVGSLLLGTESFIKKARRIRKIFGGGMRQAGYLAAAGLYALDHHVERLKEDHEHARLIADAVKDKDFVQEVMPVETNIVIFTLTSDSAPALVARLKEEGILAHPIAPNQVRMVTHLDITPDMTQKTIDTIKKIQHVS